MWNIKLNDEQMQIVQDALDMYSRVGMGQLACIVDHPDMRKAIFDNEDLTFMSGKEYFNELKSMFFDLSSGEYYGIYSDKISDSNRVSWDILQVIRNKLAYKRNPEGGMQVCFDTPLQSSGQPLPVITED